MNFDEWYGKAKGEMSHWTTFSKCEAAWNAALSQQAGQAVTLTDAEIIAVGREYSTDAIWLDFAPKDFITVARALLAKAAPVAAEPVAQR